MADHYNNDNNGNNGNNGNNRGNGHTTEYCVLCRRPDTSAGRMIHLPGNMCVCPDCMQKMMDFAGKMDLSNMTGDPNSLVNPPDAVDGLDSYEGDISNCMVETHGGLVIDVQSQVHDVWGEVIPRLYASGCTCGTNVMGNSGRYPGCGCYVAFSVCYGRIAGANVAALDNWE